MLAMNAVPALQTTTGGHDSDTDSDDSDVAFAYMDFGGVDFGDDGAGDGDVVEETAIKATDEDDELPLVGDQSNNDEEQVTGVDDMKGEGSDLSNIEPTKGDCAPSSQSQVGEVQTNATTVSSMETPTGSSISNSLGRIKALSSITFDDIKLELNDADEKLLAIEKDTLLPGGNTAASDKDCTQQVVQELFHLLDNGKYAEILRSDAALGIFGSELGTIIVDQSSNEGGSMIEQIKRSILTQFSEEMSSSDAISKCIQVEIIGIASLNLFLQLNYTGPSMDRGLKPEEGEEASHPLDGINPHGMFQSLASKENDKSKGITNHLVSSSAPLSAISEDETKEGDTKDDKIHSLKETNTTDAFHNAVLSELAVDGEWPFQVCVAPYFLLLARAVLSILAEPRHPFSIWSDKNKSLDCGDTAADTATLGINSISGAKFAAAAKKLSGSSLWSARAIVAHRRLISTKRDDDDGQACPTLWSEAEAMFSHCMTTYCDNQNNVSDDECRNTHVASEVMLEWGLAQHHFRKLGRGKTAFNKALEISKLEVEVTGAEGKRTKFQQKATAQYLVRAKPTSQNAPEKVDEDSLVKKNANIEKQMIKHDEVSDDAILLEKIKFEEQDDNVHYNLSILDQSILLAMCLDVKNDNPMDGLTGEQMGAYLARVLNQHDDWMVYSTALLERAWLECERVHGRERAILQIQALADQHSNRLTLTQSTFKSVEEESAPAQERLRHIHGIVYPPRWDMLRDLAERYAKLGVVTSAAEMFEELELWDEVVECYRIAGRESRAVEVVRARLAEKETPRMLAALGDLTKDPKCFERSLELSNGKFYDAHVALGKYYFDKGDLRQALKHFLEGLEIKPLMPAVWFRVGTVSMQLREWDTALRAFTEVVQQEPEEGDAWANVAAIHMHRKNPSEAYPALIESLKQNRNNWRVFVSKLYTCIDLKKYDEAIQTCHDLLSLKARLASSGDIPTPEEKCIRAIVGGSLKNYYNSRAASDDIALDSSKRTLARVKDLLEKMKLSMKSEAWIYEVSAHFNEEMGWREDMFNDLMKEYRMMQSTQGWENDPAKVSQMTNLVRDIFSHHVADGKKESLVKCKLMIKGVKKKIIDASCDTENPNEIAQLDELLLDLENKMT